MDVVGLDEIINSRRASSGAGARHNGGDRRAGRAHGRPTFRSNERGGRVAGGAVTRDTRRPNRFSPYAKDDTNASGRGMTRNAQQIKKMSNAMPNKNLKIHLSNVNFGVTTENIQEIFNEFGPLKSVDFHYNQFGRSLGTASVRFENPKLKSIHEWYNVPLNGRHMKIKLSDLPNTVNYNLWLGSPATMSGGNTRGGGIQRNRGNLRGCRGNNNRGKSRISGRDAREFK